MREFVIIISQPIYDTGLAGLGGVIALSVVLELIKRFFIGMANALSLMPSLLIPTVVGTWPACFSFRLPTTSPRRKSWPPAKNRALCGGLCRPCFSMCSATRSITLPRAIWLMPAPTRPQRSWAFGRPIYCFYL